MIISSPKNAIINNRIGEYNFHNFKCQTVPNSYTKRLLMVKIGEPITTLKTTVRG